MKIQIGEVYMDKVTNKATMYPNKTRKFILPCLKEYGTEFMGRLNNVFKVAVGIGDIIVKNRGIKNERHVFILLDSKIASKYFNEFILWIKDQPMYEDDYVYDNIQKSTYHMIVLKFPEKYYDSFETFKEGKYSQMFSKETIKNFFQVYPDVSKVLIKDHNYRVVFVGKLNKKFNTTITSDEWEGELELPPTDKTETFNHHLKKNN